MIVSMCCSKVAHLPFKKYLNVNTTLENGKMSVFAFALFAWFLFAINKVRRVLINLLSTIFGGRPYSLFSAVSVGI